MKLKDVEIITHLLNSTNLGPYLFLENGKVINKNEIEHFVIVHAVDPSTWEINNSAIAPKKKVKKAVEKSESEMFADLAADENSREEEIDIDEQTVSMDDDDVHYLIAKNRRISSPSLTVLKDDGWFICPVYKYMDGLYPCLFQKLADYKGYRINISSVPLIRFSESKFNEDNFKDWELNSMFILNSILDNNADNTMGISTQSIFVHKKTDRLNYLIKKGMDRLKITQKSRIKMGDILINEVLVYVGQEAYAQSKENIAKSLKGNAEVTKYDIQDVKIIDMVVEAYKKINRVAEACHKTVPIRVEKTFNSIIEEISLHEENDIVEKARAYQAAAKFEMDMDIPYEEAYAACKVLKTSDYISSFVTYVNTKIYLQMCKVEQEAGNMIAKLVQQHPLWTTYFNGIRGIGELTAGAIIADIDFRSTVHPSSIIRYLGLDNIADKPEHKPWQKITEEEINRIVRYLFADYNEIRKRENEHVSYGIPALDSKYNWEHFYATDAINKQEEFETIGKIYNMPTLSNYTCTDLYNQFPEFKKIIDYMWMNYTLIDKYNGNGTFIPVIHKRARRKSDKVMTTYVTKDGKIGVKYSLGYNAELKSKLLQVMWDNMQRMKNKYYVDEVYKPYRARLEERMRIKGEDPTSPGLKGRCHLMARRYAVQRFIEDMWKHCRQINNWPLNGGTYYEDKLQGIHRNGLNPAVHNNQ